MTDRMIYHIKREMLKAKTLNAGDIIWKAVVAFEQEASERRAVARLNRVERWEENDKRFSEKRA